MTEKSTSKLIRKETESLTIKIRGVVTEPKCWSARYFAGFAIGNAPKRYIVDSKFLFELEWRYLMRTLFAKGVQVPNMGEPLCAVWVNEEFIGDDIALCRYLLNDGYVAKYALYDVLNVNVQISTDPINHCPRNVARAYVYFSVEIDGENIGKMLFEIYTDLMPLSCDRFLKECKRYNGCAVHRITRDGWFEAGRFDQEDPPLREKRPPGLSNYREGMLSLVNFGRTNTKSSQFIVTFVPAIFLDPYQCPIGALLDGEKVLEKLNQVETYFDSPMQEVYLKNVTILYAPHDVIKRNYIRANKTIEKPANVWIQEDIIKGKSDGEKFRMKLEPEFEQIYDFDEKLNAIKLKLCEENKKLQEIIDEPRLDSIVKSVLLKEKQGATQLYYGEDEIKAINEEKWYSILINASSEFDLYYKPEQLPKLASDSKSQRLHKLALINNPTVIDLLKHINNRELNTVISLINRLLLNAMNEAVVQTTPEIFIEPLPVLDESTPLGDEINHLPQSMQDLLLNEVCNLSTTAIDLLRSALKDIKENMIEAKPDDEDTSLSGVLLTFLPAITLYLNINQSNEEEIVKRKELLLEEVKSLEGSMIDIHNRSKSEPLPPIISHAAAFFKDARSKTSV